MKKTSKFRFNVFVPWQALIKYLDNTGVMKDNNPVNWCQTNFTKQSYKIDYNDIDDDVDDGIELIVKFVNEHDSKCFAEQTGCLINDEMRVLKKELWPTKVTIKQYHDDIELWLIENLGEFRKDWNAVYSSNQTDYYFKNEKIASFFAMKWA